MFTKANDDMKVISLVNIFVIKRDLSWTYADSIVQLKSHFCLILTFIYLLLYNFVVTS